jgi:hypothetical protein
LRPQRKYSKKEDIYACLKKHLDIEYIYEVDVEPAKTGKENEVLASADIMILEDIHSALVEASEMGNFTLVEEILAGLKSKEGETHPALNALVPFIKKYDVNGILRLLKKMGKVESKNRHHQPPPKSTTIHQTINSAKR